MNFDASLRQSGNFERVHDPVTPAGEEPKRETLQN
jgi:hypothetical protein